MLEGFKITYAKLHRAIISYLKKKKESSYFYTCNNLYVSNVRKLCVRAIFYSRIHFMHPSREIGRKWRPADPEKGEGLV